MKPDYGPRKRGFGRSFALLPARRTIMHHGRAPQYSGDVLRVLEHPPPRSHFFFLRRRRHEIRRVRRAFRWPFSVFSAWLAARTAAEQPRRTTTAERRTTRRAPSPPDHYASALVRHLRLSGLRTPTDIRPRAPMPVRLYEYMAPRIQRCDGSSSGAPARSCTCRCLRTAQEGTGERELYDLARDPGGTNALAGHLPSGLGALVAVWEVYVHCGGDRGGLGRGVGGWRLGWSSLLGPAGMFCGETS